MSNYIHLQHQPENRNRFSESTMRRFKVLERPLCVLKDAWRSKACLPEGRNRFPNKDRRKTGRPKRRKQIRMTAARGCSRTALVGTSALALRAHDHRVGCAIPPCGAQEIVQRAGAARAQFHHEGSVLADDA